ncbi:hypothetical protein LXL04_003026 [Taraxacum kok-saghyz]
MLTHIDRGWMYKRKEDGYLSETYKESVDYFLDVAFSNEAIVIRIASSVLVVNARICLTKQEMIVILMLTHIDRGWMYKRKEDGYLSETYKESVDYFLDVAFSNEAIVDKNCIKCPCSKCKNLPYKTRDDVKLHLQQYGFIPNYTTWWAHGETTTFQHDVQPPNPMEDDDFDGCSRMVMD